MKTNVEKDTRKSIDRFSIATSAGANHTFKTIDKTAKKISDIINEKKSNINTSKLETSVNFQDINTNDNKSNIKTNCFKDDSQNLSTSINPEKTLQTNIVNSIDDKKKENTENKFKTLIEKSSQKIFKFSPNQGKISKSFTVFSKTGSNISKDSQSIVRTSRELNKMISSDGTGNEYLNDKISRTSKRFIYKKTNKIRKKINNKLGKVISKTFKVVLKKTLKLLISLFTMLSEFIIPLSFIILIIILLGSVFGTSGNETMISKYKTYMNDVQNYYNDKVDDFLLNNPDGIVIGVNGEYGKIDWRIPLSIIAGTGAYLEFDEEEINLLKLFQEADLLEKHEIVNQVVEEKDLSGNIVETTRKVLVITNATYDEYLEWCKNNFIHLSNFNKLKGIYSTDEQYFTSDQIELIDMLYNSSDFIELLGDDFKTKTPHYGSNSVLPNLNSKNYNSNNVLTVAGFKGQCTWFAYGRALELFNIKMPSGNAQTWLNSAVAMGYETGTQPSYNSVIVLMGSTAGHVAYVEAYDGKSITISEGNIGNPCKNNLSCSAVEYANEHANEMVRIKTYESFDEYKNKYENSGYRVVGFIYLE